MTLVFYSLILSIPLLLSPVANAQDFLDLVDGGHRRAQNCRPCEGCVTCESVTDIGGGYKEVVLSAEGCKEGNAISWFCCRAATTSTGEQQGACELDETQTVCGSVSGYKCETGVKYTYKVPADATSLQVELKDGGVEMTHCPENGFCKSRCNGAGACGQNNQRSVCRNTVYLSTCPIPEPPCHGECIGDPHFKTWGGHWYDYHGQCDLIFLTEPTFAKGLGLDIHIRTTARDDFSYIESAAIRIGSDVLEVGGWGEYLLNGVDGAEFPAQLGPYPIHYEMEKRWKHHFTIPYGSNKSIHIYTVKDLVAVQMVNATSSDFKNSGGMMGQFGTGNLIGRDGKTDFGPVRGKHHHHNEFGLEWQVREDEPKIFEDSARHPQAPAKCILPEKKAATQRRLGESNINREDAEKACAHWGDAMEHCIFDVMAMNDLEVAEFPGAL